MAKPGVNVYDIRKECVGPLCYDFTDADEYLNSKGGGRGRWGVCVGGGHLKSKGWGGEGRAAWPGAAL